MTIQSSMTETEIFSLLTDTQRAGLQRLFALLGTSGEAVTEVKGGTSKLSQSDRKIETVEEPKTNVKPSAIKAATLKALEEKAGEEPDTEWFGLLRFSRRIDALGKLPEANTTKQKNARKQAKKDALAALVKDGKIKEKAGDRGPEYMLA